MRAVYDTESEVLGIDLVPFQRLDWGESETHNAAVVHFLDDQPVSIDLLGPRIDVEEPLAAVAQRYELDLQVLQAAARAALAVPDRWLDLTVHAGAVV